MANRRNTQRTPPRQRPDWAKAEDLEKLRVSAVNAIGRLDGQLAIFERAFISLAQDVEFITTILDREGLLEDDDAKEESWDADSLAEVLYDPETALNPPGDSRDTGHTVSPTDGPEESPEEAAAAARAEAARLIAEAEALNETTVEEYRL